MTSCHHHSGYLADDEAGHTPYLARVPPPKKPALPKMGQTSRLGHMPHPPVMYGPSGSSGLCSHRQKLRGPRPFGSFLDFLVEGQVLDSLQRVVEEAAERVATMKTETGAPLVEVQDPAEMPRGGRRVRSRPSHSTVHRHRVKPSLFTGHLNNYPSCSSSMSDSHSSIAAGCVGFHSQGSNLSCHDMGPLPPLRDRLLQEKSLKRLLQLENRGKSLGQSCSQGYSLLWDSLGSSSGIPAASELGPGEREPVFLQREFNKEIKSLLSQPESFNLPSYFALREPHLTLDFLAKHHLFPALQSVVNQAVDKLSGACHHNGYPLFPSEWEPSTEPNLETSKEAIPTEGEEEPDDSLPTTASSYKVARKKNSKSRGRGKMKECGSPVSSAQGVTKFRLQVIPTEETKVLSPHPRQEESDQGPKEQRQPMFTSGPLSSSQRAQPWRRLHLTLPNPRIKVEVPSQACLTQSPNYESMKKTRLPSISSKSSARLSNPCHEELVNYLMEQAVSLLVCKYKFEMSLAKQLGFISFPITETLMDLLLGFKKVKGSHICLSSAVDWSCLLQKLEEAQWDQQVPQQVPQQESQNETFHHTAHHRSASQHSRESCSTLPKPAVVTDQEVAEGEHLHTELLVPQLLTPQENNTAEEQEPENLSESKLSMSYRAGTGSNQYEQVVATGESQSSEEKEEDKN